MTRSVPLAVLCAACCHIAAGFGQECWGMGETCGDDARCSGMDTRCGDRSECSGSSSKCGANSVCSGIDSQCGPGSQCTGLGAQCAGGQQTQWESEKPMHFKPMKPMHFKPMKPMHFKKMHFEHEKTEQPQKVFVHGCDQGDVCSGRPDAAQSNGVTVCCQEGCAECSASTSQSGNELTATCVCNALAETTTEQPKPQVKAMGCEMGSVCNGRPGAAQTAGLELCCPESCGNCMVYGQVQGGDLTAMCMCQLTSELAEEPEPRAGAEEAGRTRGLPDAATFEAAAALTLGCVLALIVAAGRKLRPCEAQQPLLSA